MTRLLLPAERAAVELEDGVPVSITWRGKRHRVLQLANRWRADAEWWRVRHWREHYKLITDSGLLLVIYHDLSREAWYVQRVYD
ncbi:MAG: hypothetical protein IT298_16145 [Chloroflexi bacterium]|nr:hypothetical protein [Chloroflexota bacterium]RIK20097.1 MAG: hypothetical protein DCC53_11430 [Chloroflexota bacterium]